MTNNDIEKWDNIMFSLLENEIDPKSKDAYFREISNDSFLAKRWEHWQNTKFHNDEVLEPAFIESLKKEEERKGLFWIPMGIAATIALIAVIVLNSSPDNKQEYAVVVPPEEKKKEIFVEQIDLNFNNKPIAMENKAPNHTVPATSIIGPSKTEYPQLTDNSIQNNLKIDFDTMQVIITDDIKTIAQVEKPEASTLIDSTVLRELRDIVAQKQRARGNDIVVQIEDNSGAVASNVDRAIKKTLGNYELAGKRTRYSVIKEECEENLYCYTLVIENNQNKTYLKL